MGPALHCTDPCTSNSLDIASAGSGTLYEVALAVGAAELGEGLGLGWGFDAFGDGFDVEGVAELDDGLGQARVGRGDSAGWMPGCRSATKLVSIFRKLIGRCCR